MPVTASTSVLTRDWAKLMMGLKPAPKLERTKPSDGTRDWATWDAEHQGSDRGRGIDDALKHARTGGLSLSETSLESGNARRTSRMFPRGTPERSYHEGRAAGYAHHLSQGVKGLSTPRPEAKRFDAELQSAFNAARERQLAKVQHHNLVKSTTSFGTRHNWAKWDLEHEHAGMGHARRHIHDAARQFHEAGGTIETVHPDQARAVAREIVDLKRGLVEANGGPLSPRAEKGFQLAQVAVTSGRAIQQAVVRVARTKDGHIAAVSSVVPRPTLQPRSHHLAMMGSTRIAHGAGSALTQVMMQEAAGHNMPVTLEPLDDDAVGHWRGNLGAHAGAVVGQPPEHMGWSPSEVKDLVAA